MAELEGGTCRSCGARLEPDAEHCALCGWPVGIEDHDLREEPVAVEAGTAIEEEGAVDSGERKPFCHLCGWQNPSGARFCSSCGTKLQEATPDSRPKSKAEPRPSKSNKKSPASVKLETAGVPESQAIQGWQVGVMIVAGVLVVAALYLITGFSKRAFPTVAESPAQSETRGEAATQQETAPSASSTALPEDLAARVETLETEAKGQSGDARVAVQREIVTLFSESGRPDRAAPVQEEIAQAVNSAEDWFQAGHFLYDWMDTLSGEQRFIIAQRAASAYESGLQITDDLNIRTALAMAYLNTRTPMLGVQQIRQVLTEEPDHLQGNFYYGVMLMQINRLEQAEAQFERVKQLVDEGSPLYEQADMMLQNLRSLN